MTTQKVTRKNATATATATAKVATASVPKTATAKVATAKTAKVATASVPMVTGENIVRTIEQVAILANMIRGLNDRIETLEKVNLSLVSQCETLERIIVGVQTATATAKVATATATVTASVPKTATAKVATASVPKTATAKVTFDSYDDLIAQCVDSVIEGINEDRFCEKVIPQSDCDLRGFMSYAVRKAVKAYRTVNPVSLATIANDIAEKFALECDVKASDYVR